MKTINPLAKIITTIIFLLMVAWVDKYEFDKLLILAIYPLALVLSSPSRIYLKAMFVSLPLAVGVGMFSPLLSRDIMVELLGIPISYGFVAFATIVLKSLLSVTATVGLLANTGITRISDALFVLHVPSVLVDLLNFTYRYIAVFVDEVGNTYTAYKLRSSRTRGILMRHWGALLGHLFLRAYARAQNIYNAMLLRGFETKFNREPIPFHLKDFVYIGVYAVYVCLCWLWFGRCK